MPIKTKLPKLKKLKGPVRTLKAIELPEHIHVSNDELAIVTRLVRIMRQRDHRGRCWLGPFIEWLLYLDAANPDLVYIEQQQVIAGLQLMGSEVFLQEDCKFFKAVLKQCPGLTFASAPISAAKDLGELCPEDEEEQFYHLIQLWRKDYPEPPKPRQIPKGKTQHEMDPDSD